MADTIPFRKPAGTALQLHNARVIERVERQEDRYYLSGLLQPGSPAYVRAARRSGQRLSDLVNERTRQGEDGPSKTDAWLGKIVRDLLGVNESTPPEEKERVLAEALKRREDNHINR